SRPPPGLRKGPPPRIPADGRKDMSMAEERASPSKLRYEDCSDLLETFADSIGPCSFDGQLVRLVFIVTRFDPGNPGQAQSGRRIPGVPAATATSRIWQATSSS